MVSLCVANDPAERPNPGCPSCLPSRVWPMSCVHTSDGRSTARLRMTASVIAAMQPDTVMHTASNDRLCWMDMDELTKWCSSRRRITSRSIWSPRVMGWSQTHGSSVSWTLLPAIFSLRSLMTLVFLISSVPCDSVTSLHALIIIGHRQ